MQYETQRESFEEVRDRICYRLVGYERNRKSLERQPHIRKADLAITFHYLLNPLGKNKTVTATNSGAGNGRYPGGGYAEDCFTDGGFACRNIGDRLLESWGKSITDLYQAAMRNTPVLFPAFIRPIERMLCDLGYPGAEIFAEDGTITMDRKNFGNGLYVLTNGHSWFGASCVLYPGLLEAAAGLFGGRYFLLPSSVHEMLLLKADAGTCAADLKTIVEAVNREEVGEDEILSDSVYFYRTGYESFIRID